MIKKELSPGQSGESSFTKVVFYSRTWQIADLHPPLSENASRFGAPAAKE